MSNFFSNKIGFKKRVPTRSDPKYASIGSDEIINTAEDLVEKLEETYSGNSAVVNNITNIVTMAKASMSEAAFNNMKEEVIQYTRTVTFWNLDEKGVLEKRANETQEGKVNFGWGPSVAIIHLNTLLDIVKRQYPEYTQVAPIIADIELSVGQDFKNNKIQACIDGDFVYDIIDELSDNDGKFKNNIGDYFKNKGGQEFDVQTNANFRLAPVVQEYEFIDPEKLKDLYGTEDVNNLEEFLEVDACYPLPDPERRFVGLINTNQIYQYNSYVTDFVEKSKEGSKGLFIGKLVICPPMINTTKDYNQDDNISCDITIKFHCLLFNDRYKSSSDKDKKVIESFKSLVDESEIFNFPQLCPIDIKDFEYLIKFKKAGYEEAYKKLKQLLINRTKTTKSLRVFNLK